MANINEKLKLLGPHEKIQILERVTGMSSNTPKELAVITAEVLVYYLENKKLPAELTDPDTWFLPE